eukprot:1189122-Prorocentrum_minimum.AAC.1
MPCRHHGTTRSQAHTGGGCVPWSVVQVTEWMARGGERADGRRGSESGTETESDTESESVAERLLRAHSDLVRITPPPDQSQPLNRKLPP